MRVVLFPCFLAACLAVHSCGSSRQVASSTSSLVIREHTELVPALVEIQIPEIKAERMTRDTISHLENDWAVSNAAIRHGGTLYHSLAIKPQNRTVETVTQVFYRDSIQVVEKEVEKSVPMPLTWWQMSQIRGFWVVLAILAILVSVKLIKIWTGLKS